MSSLSQLLLQMHLLTVLICTPNQGPNYGNYLFRTPVCTFFPWFSKLPHVSPCMPHLPKLLHPLGSWASLFQNYWLLKLVWTENKIIFSKKRAYYYTVISHNIMNRICLMSKLSAGSNRPVLVKPFMDCISIILNPFPYTYAYRTCIFMGNLLSLIFLFFPYYVCAVVLFISNA